MSENSAPQVFNVPVATGPVAVSGRCEHQRFAGAEAGPRVRMDFTMMLTLSQLQSCMPYAGDRAAVFLECLNHSMSEFSIDSLARQACFLAQVAHESGSLKYTRELADGSDYEGRDDLGNVFPGDGKKYPGRGLLQVTGRTNTIACLTALGRKPDDVAYLESPMGASRSAGWFWRSRNLNAHADTGAFWSLSKAINGGTNGLDDRIRHYLRCRKALGI